MIENTNPASATVPKAVVILVSALAIPIVIALMVVSGGAILPHLPGQAGTWNIQYMLHLGIALVAASVALAYRRRIGKKWAWGLFLWNVLWAALALYATYSLWGDKY